MSICHLVLGGARSGKSRFAEQCALNLHNSNPGDGALVYLATATAGDKEMEHRIAHHQQRRGCEWQLIEEPLAIDSVIECHDHRSTILIDCLTLWLSNCLHEECWPDYRDAFLHSLENTAANVIMVSNEVGSGVIPMGELSRQFVDESGRLHQQIAQLANKVSLIVAGIEVPVKGRSE